RDGAALTLYLDGKPAGSAALAATATATASHVVIGRLSGGGGFFDGFLRDVCVWRGVRSAVDLGGELQRVPVQPDTPGAAAVRARWRPDAVPAPAVAGGPAVVPDAMTPLGVAPRPRDGTPVAAAWRDVLRPLDMGPALHDGLAALLDGARLLTARIDV